MKRCVLMALVLLAWLLISCSPPEPAPKVSAPGVLTTSPEETNVLPPEPEKAATVIPAPDKTSIVPPTPEKPPGTPTTPHPVLSPAPPLPSPPPGASKEPATVAVRRGTIDPALEVRINQPDKTWPGTTILADNHDLARPRIIEVNMLGEVVWQYEVAVELRQYTNPGFDVEPLPDGNVLFVLPRNGVYEIDRKGKVVWSYLDKKVSHDADRLANGNTLIAYGASDELNDPQAREVTPAGKVVWAWYARDYFNQAPYKDVFLEGWTHTNSVSRLANGNTLVSLRNFHFIVEVDAKGAVVRTIGEGILKHQHDPEMLPNGNILIADHSEPQRAIELDPKTNGIAWQFVMPNQLVRDANRLPNGNTLVTGATVIAEVSPDGRVVWQLRLKDTILGKTEAPARGFYKAERIGAP